MYTQFFGNYLLANGYVTRDQLFSAMRQEADQHMKLGTLAIHAGYMNAAFAWRQRKKRLIMQ